jgi:hypothetical protein
VVEVVVGAVKSSGGLIFVVLCFLRCLTWLVDGIQTTLLCWWHEN